MTFKGFIIVDIDFWIFTKYVSALDSECINERNIEIYKCLVKRLIEIFKNFDLKWCVMRSEIEIPERLSFEKVMKNNENMITCFILPKKCELDCI